MTVKASDVAAFLGIALKGHDFVVQTVCPADRPQEGRLLYVKKLLPRVRALINSCDKVLVLTSAEHATLLTVPNIIVSNPKLAFARVVQRFFVTPSTPGIAGTAVIAETAVLGRSVNVGHFSVIGANVQIGDETEIGHHVIIRDNCTIGSKSIIKSNTVIGEKGFGFEVDEEGKPIAMPHLGSVTIGDNVEIGALNSVAAATLSKTTICDWVKTSDQVHIAHNVFIGQNTLIMACAEISGSATIGRDVWLGPNCSIMNGIEIGDGAMVGIGAVVIKSVEPNTVVVGNPARPLRKRFT